MISTETIIKKIINKLSSIGINPEVNGEPSHTANLIAIIVEETISEIKRNAEVTTVVNTTGISGHPGTPESHMGTGYGKPGSIK